jgi:large subunit ribosomal protein L5
MNKLEYIFKKKYNRLILNKLNLKTIHELPTVDSIYINLGLSNSKSIKLNVLVLYTALYIITGQKPVPTMSLKSISNFKLREGQLIGLKCTLRRKLK